MPPFTNAEFQFEESDGTVRALSAPVYIVDLTIDELQEFAFRLVEDIQESMKGVIPSGRFRLAFSALVGACPEDEDVTVSIENDENT